MNERERRALALWARLEEPLRAFLRTRPPVECDHNWRPCEEHDCPAGYVRQIEAVLTEYDSTPKTENL